MIGARFFHRGHQFLAAFFRDAPTQCGRECFLLFK